MNPPLLFITGWAHGREAVQPMADALADGIEPTILTGAEVLATREIPDCEYLVTGSMGGLLAMELLPKTCKKLALISSTAKFCAGDGYPHGTQEKVLRRMNVQLQRNPEAVLDEFFKNVHYPRRESRQAMTMRHNAEWDLDDLVAGLTYLLESDVRKQVPNINIPVLLLHGNADRIIPATASQWLNAHLPISELKMIENGGHALPAHQFATIMTEIRSFLFPRP